MKPLSSRATVRFLKAYFTAISIIFSYWWFFFKARIRRPGYIEDNISSVHRASAKKIQSTILSLQGLFIKIGQLFSIMTNFLPVAFREGLENLQDSVPARPYEQIRRQIKKELGGFPEDIFLSFEQEPVAAASLGQVHIATTVNGEKVAVKVRHLEVEQTAKADLKTIWRILQMVKKFVNVRGLDNYYYEIEAMIKEELDFEKEAAYIAQISGNFIDSELVSFPAVFAEYSSGQVLTLEYIDGIKISETEKLKQAGLDLSTIATNLITVYCQMIFVDGIYHADPHPGNVMVQNDGKIVLIDFGAVGVLEPGTRAGLGSLMEAIIKGDEEQLLRSLKQMGFLRIGANHTEAATRVIEHFHRKFQEEIKVTDFSFSSIEIDAGKGFEHLADLKGMNVGIRELASAFHVPREWVLLERMVLQLTGICTTLDKNLNPAKIVRPYLEEFVLGEDMDWSQMMFDLSREKVMSFLSLPKLFDKFINRALAGQLKVQFEGHQSGFNLVYLGVQQLAFAFLAGISSLVAVYFDYTGKTELLPYAIWGGGGFIFLMLISMIQSGKYKK